MRKFAAFIAREPIKVVEFGVQPRSKSVPYCVSRTQSKIRKFAHLQQREAMIVI